MSTPPSTGELHHESPFTEPPAPQHQTNQPSRGTTIKPPLIRFGAEVAAILKRRPQSGPLFPHLRTVRPSNRATEFKQRCRQLEISGITLHCYRYAWAECARKCGNPQRFAQEALGHNSKAVHHAYSKHAEVAVPSLGDWEKEWKKNPQAVAQPKILPVDFRSPQAAPDTTPRASQPAALAQSR